MQIQAIQFEWQRAPDNFMELNFLLSYYICLLAGGGGSGIRTARTAPTRPTTARSTLVQSPRSELFSGLQRKSLENGNYSMNERRLSGNFARKVRISPAQRLCDVEEARVWRVFPLRKKDFL